MVRVTEAAALASARWMGQGDRKAANKAAVEAMRHVLDSIHLQGTVIIGEGEKLDTPLLYVGEKVGCGHSPEVDIALDALESTNSVAYGRPNAIAVIAIANKNDLLAVPDIYMDKIAVGEEAASAIDLSLTIEENLKRVAGAKGYSLPDLTVAVLDRPRHEDLVARIRKLGTRIHLIPDGDVSGAVAAALSGTGVDLLMGRGGAPEGVLAAAAIRCIGGELQARFAPANDEERRQLEIKGITDPGKIYSCKELARGNDIMFAATGVTDGELLNGVRYRAGGAATHSFVTRSATGTRRFIVTEHYFEGKPQY